MTVDSLSYPTRRTRRPRLKVRQINKATRRIKSHRHLPHRSLRLLARNSPRQRLDRALLDGQTLATQLPAFSNVCGVKAALPPQVQQRPRPPNILRTRRRLPQLHQADSLPGYLQRRLTRAWPRRRERTCRRLFQTITAIGTEDGSSSNTNLKGITKRCEGFFLLLR